MPEAAAAATGSASCGTMPEAAAAATGLAFLGCQTVAAAPVQQWTLSAKPRRSLIPSNRHNSKSALFPVAPEYARSTNIDVKTSVLGARTCSAATRSGSPAFDEYGTGSRIANTVSNTFKTVFAVKGPLAPAETGTSMTSETISPA